MTGTVIYLALGAVDPNRLRLGYKALSLAFRYIFV